MVAPSTPVYQVRFSGSTGWTGYNFGWTGSNKWSDFVSSISVKPGITTAIGSFEIKIPDSGSNGEAFKGISLYDDVHIWLGYDQIGTNPLFRGKIDSIQTKFDSNTGWVRTFSGRDYGEALHRILGRQMWTGSASTIAGLIKDKAGLASSNAQITSDSTASVVVQSNKTCFDAEREHAEIMSKDFYVDIDKIFHWYPRQTTNHAQPTLIVGTNILNYEVYQDITDSKNQIYVFGMRNPDGTTGSDIPTGHDDWTEASTGSWTAGKTSGSTAFSVTAEADNASPATGSYSMSAPINISYNESYTIWLRKTFPSKVMINSADILHLYYGCEGHWRPKYEIRLETNTSNYFTTYIEHATPVWPDAGGKMEKSIPLGPEYEGVAITGSPGTDTGSYKWARVGTPDWYNLNSFYIIKTFTVTDYAGSPEDADLHVDGLYFGTRFQTETGSTGSQTKYGLRELVIQDNQYTSTAYCVNAAKAKLYELSGSIIQIEVTITGSPDLVVGDLYHLSIPSDGIVSSSWYDLIDLEHNFDSNGFISKCTFSDRKEIRVPIPIINYPIQQAIEKRRIPKQFLPYGIYEYP